MTTKATKYSDRNQIRKGDRVQHPDGRVGTVLVDPGWAVQIQMDGEAEPELWQMPFVVIHFTLLKRGR